MRYSITLLLIPIILFVCIVLILQLSKRLRCKDQEDHPFDPSPEGETPPASDKLAPMTHDSSALDTKPIAEENDRQKELEYRYKKTCEIEEIDYSIHRSDGGSKLGKLMESELAKIRRRNQGIRGSAGKQKTQAEPEMKR